MNGDSAGKNVINAYDGAQVIIAKDYAVIDAVQNNNKGVYDIKNSRKKIQNNKKQEYIKIWNSRLFFHVNNDVRPLTLGDAFIMPNFEMRQGNSTKQISISHTLDKVIHEYVNGRRTISMLIEGVPGIGKTSIVSWISNEYKENSDTIVLRFRDWENKELENGLLSAICHTLNCHKLDLENKILVLDGFDEIKIGNNRNFILSELLNSILDFENFKIIVTSRPNYVSSSDFNKVITLLPFDECQIARFYKIVCGTEKNKIIQVDNNDLIGIPVILYMAIVSNIDITIKTTKPELGVFQKLLEFVDKQMFTRFSAENPLGFF